MGKIFQFFTKKVVFIISLLSTIGFFVLVQRETLFGICGHYDSSCVDLVGYSILVLMLGVVAFIPSLIMVFLKPEVFVSWKKTFIFYILIYLLIVIITPWDAGDVYIPIQKDLIALIVSVAYLVFSLIYIVYKSSKK